MITKIHIENFKGIGSPGIDIELKPITLLFGANSAGKSTVLHALLYLREILNKKNLDVYKTDLGGQTVNLGGFKQMVHNNNLDSIMVLEINQNATPQDLPDYYMGQSSSFTDQYTEIPNIVDSFYHEFKEVAVKIEVFYSYELKAPLCKYSTSLDGRKIMEISPSGIQGGKANYKISYIDIQHPNLPGDMPMTIDEFSIFIESIIKSDLLSNSYGENWQDKVHEDNTELNKTVSFEIINLTNAIPNWDIPLEIDPNIFMTLEDATKDQPSYDEWNLPSLFYNRALFVFKQTINYYLLGPGKSISNELNKMLYIGPLRELPKRDYIPSQSLNDTQWSSGLGAWNKLYFCKEDLIDAVNNWLLSGDKFDTGYIIDRKKYRLIDYDNPIYPKILQGIDVESGVLKNYIQDSKELTHVKLKDAERNINLSLKDVGVGISQLLPVIVGVLNQKSSILAIEQPELHIHPKIQTELGDLFIEQINKQKNCSFLIETHSEHLMLRFLRRIEETTEEELPSNNLRLVPEQLSVYFFEQNDLDTKITHLPIDERGEFNKQWPKGFFEERAKELFR